MRKILAPNDLAQQSTDKSINFFNSSYTVSGNGVNSFNNKLVDQQGYFLLNQINAITVGKDDPYAAFNTADYDPVDDFNRDTTTLLFAIEEARNKGLDTIQLRPTDEVYEFSGLEAENIDGVNIVGFDKDSCIIKSPDGASKPVFRASGSVGVSSFGLFNLTVDGNNVNQDYDPLDSGTWFSVIQIGQANNITFRNIRVKNAVKHAVLLTGGVGGSLTGTATFTRGDIVITGVGTAFLSEVQVGDYLRAVVSGGFSTMPVAKVVSDTQLELTYPWQHETEVGVAMKYGFACERPFFENVELDGNFYDDLLGGGLWREGVFENVRCLRGAGYGFGCTQIYKCNINNLYCAYNTQGLGGERPCACNFNNVITEFNSENGVYLINGAFDINFNNLITRSNEGSGFSEAIVVVGGVRKMFNRGIVVKGIQSHYNGLHGVRIANSDSTKIIGGNLTNNGQSGIQSYGIVLTGDAVELVTRFQAIDLTITDNQTAKTQDYGILFRSSFADSPEIINCLLEGNRLGEVIRT